MTHSVKDLSVEQKALLESLLGRSISDEELVSVKAVASSSRPSEDQRKLAVENLKKHFAYVDAHRQAASDEEAEAVIDEAIRSVRPNYRPVG